MNVFNTSKKMEQIIKNNIPKEPQKKIENTTQKKVDSQNEKSKKDENNNDKNNNKIEQDKNEIMNLI